MDELKRLHIEEIKVELGEIEKMTLGDKEYNSTVEGITKLGKTVIELEKLEQEKQKMEYEHQENMRAREIELEKIEADRKAKQTEQYVNVGKYATTVGFLALFAVVSLKFEETNTLTNSVGKKVANAVWGLMRL